MKNRLAIAFFGSFLSLLMIPISATAQDSPYWVVYGGPGTAGRVYDSQSDTTTFTYTVIGKGSTPEEYNNNRLKAFKLSECLEGLSLTAFSPDLDEATNPEFFIGPNPEHVTPAEDPVGFNFTGWIWKGWRGDGTLPALLNVDEQRSFSLTYSGNVTEGPIVAGTALISNATGSWSPAYYAVPGGACESTCENRIVLDFENLQPGTALVHELSGLGVTVSASNGTAGEPDEARVFNSAAPAAMCSELGTPNTYYGGNGLPALDAASGTGVGNMSALGNVLVIPNESAAPACAIGSGTIEFSFDQPAQILALSFIDLDDTGARITATNSSSTTVFSELITPRGNNSVLTVPFGHLNTQETATLTVELFEGAALDNLVLCATPPTPTPTPTPSPSPTPSATVPPTGTPSATPSATPTPTPACKDGDITREQGALDGYTRQQANRIKKLARRLKRITNRRRDKRFARRARQQAVQLQLDAWEVTWSMQSRFTDCSGAVSNCVVSSDYQQKTTAVLSSADSLVTLSEKVLRRLGRARGRLTRRDRKIQQQVVDLYIAAQKEVDTIPAQIVSCGQVGAGT